MTINYKIVDMKLKNLIQVCKETQNYRKLAVAGFILVSNIIDEIALKLGARPREKEKKEPLIKYMNVVNEIFEKNLDVKIFHDEIVNTIKEIELLFLKNRGDLPLRYVKKIMAIYYELRKIKVPNVYKNLTGEGYYDDTNLHLFSTGIRGRKDSSSKYKPILLQKITQQERATQQRLNAHMSQEDLEKAILLKQLRRGLENKQSFLMDGALKDHLDYRKNHSTVFKFILIGVAFLAFCFGVILITEIILYPLTLPALSNLLLIGFGAVVVIIVIYKNIFRRR